MSLPDFGVDHDFLALVNLAAKTTWHKSPSRRAIIGSGHDVLSNRLVIKRDKESCIYLHVWHRSDPDDLHDHPWDWVSVIIQGGYWEVTPDGRRWRAPGDVQFRKAEERHKVELDPAVPFPVSLFITGAERREWGFHTETGWIESRVYRSIQETEKRRAEPQS